MNGAYFSLRQLSTGEVVADQFGSDNHDILTINRIRKCVTWYGSGGNKTRRILSFPTVPIQAVFCRFASNEVGEGKPCDEQTGVAVLVSSIDLQVHMVSGEVYDLTMPNPIDSIMAVPFGLLLKRKSKSEASDLRSLVNCLNPRNDTRDKTPSDYFLLTDPVSEVRSVRLSSDVAGHGGKGDSGAVCAVHEDIICQYNEKSGWLQLWQLIVTGDQPDTGLSQLSQLDQSISHHTVQPSVLSPDMEAALDAIGGGSPGFDPFLVTPCDDEEDHLLRDFLTVEARRVNGASSPIGRPSFPPLEGRNRTSIGGIAAFPPPEGRVRTSIGGLTAFPSEIGRTRTSIGGDAGGRRMSADFRSLSMAVDTTSRRDSYSRSAPSPIHEILAAGSGLSGGGDVFGSAFYDSRSAAAAVAGGGDFPLRPPTLGGPILKDRSVRPYVLSVTPTTLMDGAGFHRHSGSRRTSGAALSGGSARSHAPDRLSRRSVSSPIHKMELSLSDMGSPVAAAAEQRFLLENSHLVDPAVEASLSNAATAPAVDSVAPVAPSAHEMRLLRSVQLPLGAAGTGAKYEISFSGDYNKVGGLLLYCLNCDSGQLTIFSVRRDAHNSGEIAVVRVDQASCCGSSSPSSSAGHTRYSSVAHISVPLRDCRHVLPSAQSRLLLSGSETLVPVSLLLHATSTESPSSSVTVLMGGVEVRESVPLNWTDDMDDDDGEVEGPLVDAIATVQSHGLTFAVCCQGKSTIISAEACLFKDITPMQAPPPSSSSPPAIVLQQRANVCADLATAVIAASSLAADHDLNPVGFAQRVIALLSCASAEIGADSAMYILLCACLGGGGVSSCWELGRTEGLFSPSCGPSPHVSRSFNDVRSMCREESTGITAARAVVDLCHMLLQEYALRFYDASSSSSGDCGPEGLLRRCFQAALKTCPVTPPLKGTVSEVVHAYRLYYTPQGLSNARELSTLFDGSAWSIRCFSDLGDALQDRSSSAAPSLAPVIPPTLNLSSLLPFPTIRLTRALFASLVDLASLRLTGGGDGDDDMVNWSRAVVDAAVHSVQALQSTETEGHSSSALDWNVLVSFLSSPLRAIVDCALQLCTHDPNPDWPDYVLTVIGRRDLCSSAAVSGVSRGQTLAADDSKPSDGLLQVELASSLRFTADNRMHEVCRILRSSERLYLKLEKAPEVSDLDHRGKLQQRLLMYCRRSLAYPVGRGMLTMSSLEPLVAEALPIPPLCLTGRVAPANTNLALDLSNQPDMTVWPDFHNGVAAVLRVGPVTHEAFSRRTSSKGKSRAPKKSHVTRNWIMYNRTASQQKPGGEASHAGFLFGLGLQGHLAVLSVTDICDYLVQGNEPTTVAVLIGAAASKIGSADPLLSKTLCLHLPALLPAHHWDIEISPLVQASALIGMGLLHCGSSHRVMTEFLLAEMSRWPTSDRCESRESLTLAACWSLGMVLLGKGQTVGKTSDAEFAVAKSGIDGLADLRVEERLVQHIHGGKKPPESHIFPTHHHGVDIGARSSRILEGGEINCDATAPGAIIALSLIYMRTNNADILSRLQMPSTVVALDAIRPDLLLFRAMGRCLVMWEEGVRPGEDWVDAQVPATVTSVMFAPKPAVPGSSGALSEEAKAAKVKELFAAYHKSYSKGSSPALDPKTAVGLYLNIVSGCCWGIGLVFAGTFNDAAKATILSKLKFLQSLRDNKAKGKLPVPVDRSIRHMVESCMCVVAISLSCVMAGSGDLDCLRTLRELRFRVDDVTYGSHQALSMAIGLLFLAGGNASLRRDPLSTACLLISMCPRFPVRTSDHQFHLQPLRHMYVLATERRALHTIDADSGLPVALNVEVELVTGGKTIVRAPGLLPELSTVRKISVTREGQQSAGAGGVGVGVVAADDTQYYPLSLTLEDAAAGSSTALAEAEADPCESKAQIHRRSQRHIDVPLLYVKQMPRRAGRSRPEGPFPASDPAVVLARFKEVFSAAQSAGNGAGGGGVGGDSMTAVGLGVDRDTILAEQKNHALLQLTRAMLVADTVGGGTTPSELGRAVLQCRPVVDIIEQSMVR